MALNDLPAGLSSGRLIAPAHAWDGDGPLTDGPVCWVSDQPVEDLPGIWGRLQAAHEVTGLRPIVLEYVDDELLPERPSDIDAVDAGWKVSVATPPTTKKQAEQAALEHLLVCPDALYQMDAWTFPEYVERILGSRIWHLWWD
ncbi:DUF4253 domain-containing protein [Nonomuraea sp. NPDC050536]|uniref:DUF4253 domain-containing protein n=1 Tax=Nonomuraea sp. NPDC050536 TaxID=3364366 RepID=UPI0037C7FFB7